MKKTSSLLLAVGLPVFFAFQSLEFERVAPPFNHSFTQMEIAAKDFPETKKSNTMVIQKEIVIQADIEKCWKLLGVDFAHADRWASAVRHSEGHGAGINGASCSERSCSTTMGGLKEKLLEFSPELYLLKYQVAEGMPSMVKYATNDWRLVDLGNQQTRLTMVAEMQLGGLMGTLMKPMLRSKMSKLTGQIAEEFKFYVENGQPHPRKVKAMRKAG